MGWRDGFRSQRPWRGGRRIGIQIFGRLSGIELGFRMSRWNWIILMEVLLNSIRWGVEDDTLRLRHLFQGHLRISGKSYGVKMSKSLYVLLPWKKVVRYTPAFWRTCADNSL